MLPFDLFSCGLLSTGAVLGIFTKLRIATVAALPVAAAVVAAQAVAVSRARASAARVSGHKSTRLAAASALFDNLRSLCMLGWQGPLMAQVRPELPASPRLPTPLQRRDTIRNKDL